MTYCKKIRIPCRKATLQKLQNPEIYYIANQI